MAKGQRLDDKIFEGVDLSAVHSNDIKRFKIYDGTYFIKKDSIRVALQNFMNNMDTSKDYSGSDIKNTIKKLYDKI